MKKKYGFEKFMKDIVRREQERKPVMHEDVEHEETEAQKYRKRYAERWQNRIKYNLRGPRG